MADGVNDRDVPSAAAAGGVFEAIERIAGIDDPGAAATAYVEAMREAYWQDKDLHAVTGVGYAGVGRLLAEAHKVSGDNARELRSSAKGLLYDLASFTWPGWGEEGIAVTPNEQRAGLAAARMNLLLALRLEKGPLARSRAHWMVGAHLLTSGDPCGALEEFERAEHEARVAGAQPEADLSDAFAGLASLVATGDPVRMEAAIGRLAAHEHGVSFVDQVTTARRVLGV